VGPAAWTYAWNWDGKLRSATNGTGSIAVKYDPMGNRVYKESDDGTNLAVQRKYIVDISSGLPTILCEIDPSESSLKKSYIYAGAQILAQREHTNAADPTVYDEYFYVHDRLGSVRMVVEYDDTAGTVDTANSYTYTPYGQFYESAEMVANPWLFTGQWYDEEIAQYYLRARQYDPAMMRFTSRDLAEGKFEEPMSLHQYLYCANEPISRVDWNGETWTLPELLVDMGMYSMYGGIAGFMGGCTDVLTASMMGADMSGEDMLKTIAKYTAGGAITGAAAPLIAIGGTGSLIASYSAAEYWTLNGMLAASMGTGVGAGLIEGLWDEIDASAPLKTKMKSDARQVGILMLAGEIEEGWY